MSVPAKTSFKETEVGTIPEDWDVRPLGELTQNFDFKRIPVKESERQPGSYPYYGASGVIDHVSDYIFDGEYLLVAEDGENLRSRQTPIAFLASGKFWVNNHAHIVRATASADTRFLLYALLRSSVDAFLTGTTVPKLTQENLSAISLPCPPLNEQEGIAKILSDLDSRIGLNQRMNETLESIAKAIFKHWFVDFEFPNGEGRQYKSSGGKFIESDFGEIPMGWEVGYLDQVAEFTRGFSYKGIEKSVEDGEYLFVTLNSVKEGGGFKREFSFVSSDRLKERHFVRFGDIVIANTEQTKTGTLLGCPALVEFPLGYQRDRAVISHHITKVVPKQPSLKYFLYYYLLLHQQEAVQYNTGSVIWALDVVNWARQERVSSPPPQLIDSFNRLVDSIMQRFWENSLQAEVLAGLRDALLPKLMSGKVRVPIEAS